MAWTPLFLTAGALVMEVGGIMSHGAVVAREYGIPAVVGVKGATRLLRDGEIIEVDGATGEVRRLAAKQQWRVTRKHSALSYQQASTPQ